MKEIDQLSDLIAEMTVKHGVQRVITQEVLEERCRHYLQVAKQELEACGPEESTDSSKFMTTATVFGSRGEEAPNVRIPFKGSMGKYHVVHALSETCKTMLAQAVILRMVGTGANSDQLAKAMHLNPPETLQQFDYFHERCMKWMEKNLGSRRYADLPAELRRDIIMVCGMGPKLKDAGIVCMYRWENGKLIFGEEEQQQMKMEMIPRWWQ